MNGFLQETQGIATSLHVQEEGSPSDSQPSLLFVHGACLGAWCWEDHFLPYFARCGYHALALDLRGHGRSGGRDRLQEFSLEDFVGDVAQVASRLPKPPVVVGHSMGGLIAQRFAASHPASALILLAPSPVGGMRRLGWALLRAHLWRFILANVFRDMSKLYPDSRRVRSFMFSPKTDEATVTRCRERLQPESWRACLAMNPPISPPLSIRCPILVLGGQQDGTVTEEAILETGRAYAAPTRIFPETGHNVMLDATWEQVADAMAKWIRDVVKEGKGS
jgi:pimeloyl-ACP methyl ester carboxylesterase